MFNFQCSKQQTSFYNFYHYKEGRTALKSSGKKIIKPVDKLEYIYKETEELIAIVAKNINTAEKNKKITE
jgi:hypothetical protein